MRRKMSVTRSNHCLVILFKFTLCLLASRTIFAFTHTHLIRASNVATTFTTTKTTTHDTTIRLWKSPSRGSSDDGATAVATTQQATDDTTMEETYNKLATEIIQAFHAKKDGRLWLAVAGAPGSGKTTVARNLVQHIQEQQPELRALVVPMDGYHLTQKEMAVAGYDMKRRGAPWTFNATRMHTDLVEAHKSTDRDVLLPDYSRDISDPVPDKITLEASHDIIIIEGLYVLLGTLCQELHDPDSSTNQVAAALAKQENLVVDIHEEVQRWEPLLSLWDQTFFVEPPGGFAENKRRLVERSLQTWTPTKTDLWGGGTDREAATRRVEFNDERNAQLINCCKRFASFVIENK